MATFWRISNHADLSGRGGRIASSRWHTKGSRIVFLAESPAAAMLETLVHLEYDVEDFPDDFKLLKVAAPEDMKIHVIDLSAISDWENKPEMSRELGDQWLAQCETALARVPSVLVPFAWNVLLNPEHPNAEQVKIESVSRQRFDSRLFRFGKR